MKLFIQYELNDKGKGKFLARLIPALETLGVRIVKERKADVALLVRRSRGAFPKCPKVIRIDGMNLRKSKKNNAQIKKIYLPSMNRSDAIIYQSEFSKMMVGTLMKPSTKKMYVIYNGSPIHAPVRRTEKKILISAKFYDGHVYRPHKRLKAMYDVACQVSDTEDVSVAIAGATGGVEKSWAPHPRVSFYGHLDDASLVQQYKSSSLLLFLGWYDWCPNTVIEALSYGLPVVCGNNGGTKEIVKQNGRVVDIDEDMKPEWVPEQVPDVDINYVTERVLEALNTTFTMSVGHIDINTVAKRYYEVFKSVAR